MKENELTDAVQAKNAIIKSQYKRITLLEEKFAELRVKYFQLKYAEAKIDFHLS